VWRVDRVSFFFSSQPRTLSKTRRLSLYANDTGRRFGCRAGRSAAALCAGCCRRSALPTQWKRSSGMRQSASQLFVLRLGCGHSTEHCDASDRNTRAVSSVSHVLVAARRWASSRSNSKVRRRSSLLMSTATMAPANGDNTEYACRTHTADSTLAKIWNATMRDSPLVWMQRRTHLESSNERQYTTRHRYGGASRRASRSRTR
jgi:hypothetical protein